MPRKKLNELEWFLNLPDLYDQSRAHFKTEQQIEVLEIILTLRDQKAKERSHYLKVLNRKYYEKYHLKEGTSKLIRDFREEHTELLPAIERLNVLIDLIPEKAWTEIQNKIKKKRMSSKGVTVTIDNELLGDIAEKLGLKLGSHSRISSKEVKLILEAVKSRLDA